MISKDEGSTPTNKAPGSGSIDALEAEHQNLKADNSLWWFLLLALSAYAGQLHGFWWGAATLLALIVLVSVTNMICFAAFQAYSSRYARYGWIIIAAVAIVVSGMEVG